MASWGKNATTTGLVGAALLTAVAAFNSGCGGGGALFPTPEDRFFVPTPTPTGSATATPTPTPTPNGGPVNQVSGTITLGTGVTVEPTITLFQGKTQVAQVTAAANGAFTFPNLSAGSYTVLLTGTGLRPQWDNVILTAGSGFTLNYTMSLAGGTPSQQEVAGISASALHVARGFYGAYMATPLANALINFNEAITARTGGQTFTATPIAVAGAQQVAIDSHGHAWVTTSGTAGEVTVLSNTGTLVGQVPSSSFNPNGGAQAIAIDSNDDVAVANNGSLSFGLFPAADIHAVEIIQGEVITGQTANAIAAQNATQVVGGTTFTGPHFVATLTSPGQSQTTVPELVFFDKTKATATVNLETALGFPASTTVLGIAVASDNTLFVAANEPASGSTAPHILHLSANGSTLSEDIDLTASPFSEALGSTVQFVALDSTGNIFAGGSFGVVKIGGTSGSRTLAASNSTVPSGLAIDNTDEVFITNGTTATQFDDNLANASTGTVAAGSGSIAVDTKDNAFVVSSKANSVTRLTVGTAVGPQSGNTTSTLPDGSQVKTVVSGGTTTLTQVFQGGATDSFSFGATSIVGTGTSAADQVTLTGTSAFGPTSSTTLTSVNAVTGTATYTVDATNGIDGVTIDSTVQVFDPPIENQISDNTQETVNGNSTEGLTFTANYSAPAQDGSVFMTGSWNDTTTSDKGTISMTFAANGSIEAFTLVDTTRQLVVTSNSTGADYSSTVTVEGSQTVQGTATSNPFQDLLLAFVNGSSPDPLGNFFLQNVSTTAGVDFLNQGMTVVQSDQSTTTITAGQLTGSSADPQTGQGDGPDLDGGLGAGTFIASDGGSSGPGIRGTKK